MRDPFPASRPEPLPADDELIERYIAGESTLAEQATLERWMQAHPAMGRRLRALRIAAMAEVVDGGKDLDAEAAARRVVERVGENGEGQEDARRVGNHARLATRKVPLTPVAVGSGMRRWALHLGRGPLLLRPAKVSSVLSKSTGRRNIQAPFARMRSGVLSGIAIAGVFGTVAVMRSHWTDFQNRFYSTSITQGRRYTTTAGQFATVTLRDGSHVTLAPQTTVVLPRAFGAEHREVFLRGEAYFDVSAKTPIPFTVRTPTGVAVRVLGTTFDVATMPGPGVVRVVVLTGRVRATSPHGTSVTVIPGMAAHITDSTVATAMVNVTPYASWTSGAFVFEETPVSDVLTMLSQWYGIQLRLADTTLKHVPLTARFSAQSPSDALDLLKTILHVTLTTHRIGDTTVVTLHSRPSHEIGTDSAPAERESPSIFSSNHREVGR